jgi:cholest-4-en-3-one 26-monooxygenase
MSASAATPQHFPDNVYDGEWTKNPKIVDLNDLESFVDGYPYEAMKAVQRDYPFYWNEEKRDWGPGFWNLTRYDDIVEVSRDTDTFSSEQGINISYPPDADPTVVNAVVGNMITMDPPLHRAYRKIAQPFFANKSIQGLQARVRELAQGIVSQAVAKAKDGQPIDFMIDIAAPLPISVLCDILGVPHSDWKKIYDWSNELVGIFDPDLCEDPEGATAVFMDLFLYGQNMIEDRRKNPRQDLMTAIAQAKPDDGMEIPEHLLNGFFLLMVIAGNETTRNSISGGMKVLIEHPRERDRLVANPKLLPTAVEEIIRWVSPVNHMRRTATRDAQIRDQKIAAGDKVVLWYGMGNRDPEVFDDPWRFDIGRDPNPHIAFGIGEHFCLGARLARLQLNVVFDELMKQVPGLKFELDGKVTWVRTNFINGIKAMPVRVGS